MPGAEVADQIPRVRGRFVPGCASDDEMSIRLLGPVHNWLFRSQP